MTGLAEKQAGNAAFPRGTYDFASLMVMPDSKTVRVGLLAQVPTGNGANASMGL